MRTLIISLALITVSQTGFGQNLISNWKFQFDNMQIRCDGWFNSCGEELIVHCDTTPYCHVGFYNEAPSAIPEEMWSLQLDSGFPTEGFAETYITNHSGTNIYQLKYWMKSELLGANIYSSGTASIGQNKQNQFVAGKSISDTASFWKQLTIIDTLTTQLTDTITVRLSAGFGDFVLNRVYFDYIELTIIGTISSIDNPDQPGNSGIIVYPNPAKDKVTIEVPDSKHQQLEMSIFNSTGQQVMSFLSSGHIFSLENPGRSDGIYYYRIVSTTERKLIGEGKIVFE
jgi:hypothetical protein